MHKHMEKNKKDKDSKFRLVLVESRIHRLARCARFAAKLHDAPKLRCADAGVWMRFSGMSFLKAES